MTVSIAHGVSELFVIGRIMFSSLTPATPAMRHRSLSKGPIRLTIPGVWSDQKFPMSQAVVEPDGRRVHLTGQVGWTSDFEIVGPDDAGVQTHAAIDNIEKVLLALGGTIEDVVSTTMYYVRDGDLSAIQDARRSRFSFSAGPAVTGVKVASLVDPGLLVELTVIAVIPNSRFRSKLEDSDEPAPFGAPKAPNAER